MLHTQNINPIKQLKDWHQVKDKVYLKRFPFFNSFIYIKSKENKVWYERLNKRFDNLDLAKQYVINNILERAKQLLESQDMLSFLIDLNVLQSYPICLTLPEREVLKHNMPITVQGYKEHMSSSIVYNDLLKLTIDRTTFYQTLVNRSQKILTRHINKFISQYG